MRSRKPDKTDRPAIPSADADNLAALGAADAPIIFADEATTFGSQEGVANITLQATRHVVLPGGLRSDSVAVAHLRLTLRAVQNLRNLLTSLDQQAEIRRRSAN
jgi:hypothetical protein